MKYALVNDRKTEATKNTRGICQGCSSELIAKCGELKAHHWSHKGDRDCDKWWENETEWHRSWKNHFPKEIQEVVHRNSTGEKHIADVKTRSGWVLEFQHSFIKNEERESRNKFYQKLVWVVDGTRRKNDKKRFFTILEVGRAILPNLPIIQLSFIDDCRLVEEWCGNPFVFFDFKEAEHSQNQPLWFLFPKTLSGNVYITPFPRPKFIELFKSDNFDGFLCKEIQPILESINITENKTRNQSATILARSLYMHGPMIRRRHPRF